MKHLAYILATLLFVMTLSSCRDHDETAPIADKTILLYLPYTGNLYSMLIGNLEGVKASLEEHGMGKNSVLAFVCRDNRKDANLIQFRLDRQGKVLQDTLLTYTDPAVTTDEGIAQILSDVKQYAPAERYGLIIGAHGQGWIPAKAPARSRWYGGNSSQANVSTLGDAIRQSDIHLQFLVFDCCYMSCIENVYELRDVTDYYIASTSEMMDIGMPYRMIFHDLMLKEPDYADLNEKFHDFYTSYSQPFGTIAITDCRYAEQMATVMRQINLHHEFDMALLPEVQDLDAAHHNPTIYFDFGDYVEKLCTDPTLLQQFQSTLQKLVPAKSTTDYILSAYPLQKLPVTAFSGLTISDPSVNSSAAAKTTTSWWMATH